MITKTDYLKAMEKEFLKWYDANKKRFAHAQFDEKQIAYSAWVGGKLEALHKHEFLFTYENLFKAFVSGDTENMRDGGDIDREEFEEWFKDSFNKNCK